MAVVANLLHGLKDIVHVLLGAQKDALRHPAPFFGTDSLADRAIGLAVIEIRAPGQATRVRAELLLEEKRLGVQRQRIALAARDSFGRQGAEVGLARDTVYRRVVSQQEEMIGVERGTGVTPLGLDAGHCVHPLGQVMPVVVACCGLLGQAAELAIEDRCLKLAQAVIAADSVVQVPRSVSPSPAIVN